MHRNDLDDEMEIENRFHVRWRRCTDSARTKPICARNPLLILMFFFEHIIAFFSGFSDIFHLLLLDKRAELVELGDCVWWSVEDKHDRNSLDNESNAGDSDHGAPLFCGCAAGTGGPPGDGQPGGQRDLYRLS
jgi:hypothetical protein